MSKRKRRVFTPQFKLGVIKRMEAGESATALSRELIIKRELLYDWQRLWRREGAEALRRIGRPTLLEALERAEGPLKNLAAAKRKIAELERKVGQQALEIDFLKGCLQRIEEARMLQVLNGNPRSSGRSKKK